MSEDLERQGFEELERIIDRFPELATAAAVEAMTDALLYLHGQIPQYPPPPQPGTASKFWTDKQRRWFWWRVSQLEGPAKEQMFDYTRTGTLGRRITETVRTEQSGVEGELGMNTPYARYVVGREDQAPIHEGRWWVFEDVVEANMDGAFDEFSDTFFEEFGQAYERNDGG